MTTRMNTQIWPRPDSSSPATASTTHMRVDDEHGLAVAQPKVEQPVVEVAAIGAERRSP